MISDCACMCENLGKYGQYDILQDEISRNVNHELIDECGEVITISEHVAMLVPLYYIPLLLLPTVLVIKLSVKIRAIYKMRYTTVCHNYNYVYK